MNKIPAAIKSRLIMLSGCVVLVLIIGVFWSIVIRDAISLYLTIILVVLGVLKIYGLYRDAKDGKFNVLEGVLLSKYALTSRKEELRFICNGEEILSGIDVFRSKFFGNFISGVFITIKHHREICIVCFYARLFLP